MFHCVREHYTHYAHFQKEPVAIWTNAIYSVPLNLLLIFAVSFLLLICLLACTSSFHIFDLSFLSNLQHDQGKNIRWNCAFDGDGFGSSVDWCFAGNFVNAMPNKQINKFLCLTGCNHEYLVFQVMQLDECELYPFPIPDLFVGAPLVSVDSGCFGDCFKVD